MCGRYTYAMTNWPKVWRDFLGGEVPMPSERTWNIAPTQKVPVVRLHPDTGVREVRSMVWGLVPSWAKDMSIGSKLINARGETVAEKPSFRAAFKARRCLMLSTGFYEWQFAGEKRAQPWFIRVKRMEVFAIAGIWETWTSKEHPEAGPIETCALITIHANEAMTHVHHRMPVILPPEDWAAWLDPSRQDPADLQSFIKPCPAEWITVHPVSKAVNSPRHNTEALVAPVAVEPSGETLPLFRDGPGER